MIVACLQDDASYGIKDRKLIKFIYRLAGEHFERYSLIITSNLMRLLVLKLAAQNNTMMVRFQNFLVLSDNAVRLLIRGATALTFGIIAAICSIFSVGMLALVVVFSQTENCGFQRDRYFQQIRPQDNGALMVYAPKSTGNIIITKEAFAERFEIFIPDETQVRPNPIIKKVEGKTTMDRRYVKVKEEKIKPVAKMITFSEFIKKNPVLKTFGELKEPNVPTKQCPFTPDQIRNYT
jgi:hypothetical protein